MTTVHDHQAFPSFNEHGESLTSTDGLTKREYFAALAMQGLLAQSLNHTHRTLAVGSVQLADALIAALNGEGQADG